MEKGSDMASNGQQESHKQICLPKPSPPHHREWVAMDTSKTQDQPTLLSGGGRNRGL